MVTFDWRRCPAPTMDPPSSRPPDTGLPRDDYENGVLTDEGPMVNYGPLSSDFGPRFAQPVEVVGECPADGGNGFGWLLAFGAMTYAAFKK